MRQKDADFTALNFWTGAKMAGAARVGKWRSKSKAGGKYLLNKGGQNSEAINKNFTKHPEVPKNGNAVFVVILGGLRRVMFPIYGG